MKKILLAIVCIGLPVQSLFSMQFMRPGIRIMNQQIKQRLVNNTNQIRQQIGQVGRKSALALAGAAVLTSSVAYTSGDLSSKIDKDKYPEFAKFVQKYRCPKDIEDNRHRHHLKSAIDRIINAERMKKCIAANNLDHLRVANKCLCYVDDSMGDYMTVLSQHVNFRRYKEDAKLSLSETQQLVKLAEETGFRD